MSSKKAHGKYEPGNDKGHISYVPLNPDDSTDLPKADLNRAGYVGMADGIQSEASTSEAERLLDYDTEDGDGNQRVRNPGMRAWYTRHFNQA